ncbi:MAG: DcaP family trimeric outer membrane transporter [Pseudomonadota bacterium]
MGNMRQKIVLRKLRIVLGGSNFGHMFTFLRKAVVGLLVMMTGFPAVLHAQTPTGDEDLQELYDKLEELSRVVDQQSVQIQRQSEEISILRKKGDAALDEAGRGSAAVAATESDDGQFDGAASEELSGDSASSRGGIDAFRIGRYPDQAIVRPGDFEGSITFPGDAGSFRIGGFVRAQLDYDFDNIGIQGNAIPYSIPLDGSIDDNTQQLGFTVRDTQLNFDYRRDTEELGQLRAFVEFDFFGDGGDEFNNDYGVRIRHAAVGIGNLQVGQFWSLFTDLDSIPEVVELLGPHGAPVFRTPGIRWYDEIGDKWKWAVGIEDPAGDLSGDASQFASESVPNVVGYLERTGDWGHVRLTGLGLELKSDTDKTFTGGGSLTGRINIPFLHRRDALLFGGQMGAGFAKQYAGFGGVGLEGVVDTDGNIEATEILAGYIGYQHWWTDAWRSTGYASVFDFDQGRLAEPDSLSYSFKAGGNLFWTPEKKLNLGAEVLYITREDFNGDEGDGVRMQLVAQLNF